MGHIEDTQPISVLAERVWAGPAWHYPHIEQMCKEMRELREAVKVLGKRARDLDKLAVCYRVGKRPPESLLDSLTGPITNPIAAAAVREAGR